MTFFRDRVYGRTINPGGDLAHTFTEEVGTVAAGTAIVIPLFRAPIDMYLFSAFYTDGATLAAAGTNYTTINVADYAAGSSVANMATGVTTNTGAGNGWTALVPKDMVATVGYKVAAGDLVVLTKTDTGTGQAMTTGCITLVFK